MIRVLNVPHSSVQQRGAEVPDELAEVIDRLLQKSPTARYASAAQVRDLLAAILAREVALHPDGPGPLADAIKTIPRYSSEASRIPPVPSASSNPYLTLSLNRAPAVPPQHEAALSQTFSEYEQKLAAAKWGLDDTEKAPAPQYPIPARGGGTQRMENVERVVTSTEPPTDVAPPSFRVNTARTFSQSVRSSTPNKPKPQVDTRRAMSMLLALVIVMLPVDYAVWRWAHERIPRVEPSVALSSSVQPVAPALSLSASSGQVSVAVLSPPAPAPIPGTATPTTTASLANLSASPNPTGAAPPDTPPLGLAARPSLPIPSHSTVSLTQPLSARKSPSPIVAPWPRPVATTPQPYRFDDKEETPPKRTPRRVFGVDDGPDQAGRPLFE
jgi:hypothetical protein